MAEGQAPMFESPVVQDYRHKDRRRARVSSARRPLTLGDVSATTKWLVRADTNGKAADKLGAPFGSSNVVTRRKGSDPVLVLGSRPGEWILLGAPDAVAQLVDALPGVGDDSDDGPLVTALNWTHGRALFRLTGQTAVSVLEKVCNLDWSEPMTPNGAVVSASVANVTCDIARHDIDDTPSYLIFCDRSFGQYLFDAVLDAGEEFAIGIAAPAAAL